MKWVTGFLIALGFAVALWAMVDATRTSHTLSRSELQVLQYVLANKYGCSLRVVSGRQVMANGKAVTILTVKVAPGKFQEIEMEP